MKWLYTYDALSTSWYGQGLEQIAFVIAGPVPFDSQARSAVLRAAFKSSLIMSHYRW